MRSDIGIAIRELKKDGQATGCVFTGAAGNIDMSCRTFYQFRTKKSKQIQPPGKTAPSAKPCPPCFCPKKLAFSEGKIYSETHDLGNHPLQLADYQQVRLL
ncbi:MAG TPA: hypothetical protein ENJ29_04030 [Bacteroidetes bacterium]|nr:hypothetical protein [Bacteroidota bacterium]